MSKDSNEPFVLITFGMERGKGSDWISVSSSPLSVNHLTTWVTRQSSGAVATFCGTARAMSAFGGDPDRSVLRVIGDLDRTLIDDAIVELRNRWPETEAVALHFRVGAIDLDDQILALAVSSPNRRSSVNAADFCIQAADACISNAGPGHWYGGSTYERDLEQNVARRKTWRTWNRLTN